MQPAFLIYYLLLLAACIVTLGPARTDRTLWFFFSVLATSLAEELIFESIRLLTGHKYFVIYHLYAPVYYCLFAAYFYRVMPPGKVRKAIPYSMGFYVGGSLAAWLASGDLFLFPGLKIDLLGFLLIPLCLLSLYTLDINDFSPILSRPLFWISVSTFIFYTSDFVVIGLKTYLAGYGDQRANNLARTLNIANNYLYYLLIIIGMICSKPARRLSPP
jgi:hypothetical protein